MHKNKLKFSSKQMLEIRQHKMYGTWLLNRQGSEQTINYSPPNSYHFDTYTNNYTYK